MPNLSKQPKIGESVLNIDECCLTSVIVSVIRALKFRTGNFKVVGPLSS